ncbi:IS4 family transposase [Streptomyces halobius]|uniref:IS4 family transposase n=1 Tax=Streptomyces halobius TaxID=2879846 RepID=A0ABY4M2Q5_9ACTN|nr:IS4 family transposase [Streptomyces halobius]UQA91503.1 IS4 family transposase [Streptomyces halobius]
MGLSDQVRLGALTRWVTPELVDEVVAAQGRRDKRVGALPAGLMVHFVLGLALFHQDSYDDVAENMVSAIPELGGTIPNKSSFTRARQRLGPQVLEVVFRRVSGPLAAEGLAESFYRGLRVAAVDGFYLDAPDTAANRAAFGGQVTADGSPLAYPQVRVVALSEVGTHAVLDARVGGLVDSEQGLAAPLAARARGILVIMDRGFVGVSLWSEFTGAGAHLLIRAKANNARTPIEHLPDGTYLAKIWKWVGKRRTHSVTVRVVEYQVDGGETIRLLTDLLDPAEAPADELAALYHDRWEAELLNRQLKTYQRGSQQILRSAEPDLVRQEVWAHLTVHHCLSRLITEIAGRHKIDPDRISFVKVLKAVRRSVIQNTTNTPAKLGKFLASLASKLPKLDIGPRRDRAADRIVKRLKLKYADPPKGWTRQPTRRTPPKIITLLPRLV